MSYADETTAKAAVANAIGNATSVDPVSNTEHADVLDNLIENIFAADGITVYFAEPLSGLGDDGDVTIYENKIYSKAAGTWSEELELTSWTFNTADPPTSTTHTYAVSTTGQLYVNVAGTWTLQQLSLGKYKGAHSTTTKYYANDIILYSGELQYANSTHNPKTYDAADWTSLPTASSTHVLHDDISTLPSSPDGYTLELYDGIGEGMLFERVSSAWVYRTQTTTPVVDLTSGNASTIAAYLSAGQIYRYNLTTGEPYYVDNAGTRTSLPPIQTAVTALPSIVDGPDLLVWTTDPDGHRAYFKGASAYQKLPLVPSIQESDQSLSENRELAYNARTLSFDGDGTFRFGDLSDNDDGYYASFNAGSLSWANVTPETNLTSVAPTAVTSQDFIIVNDGTSNSFTLKYAGSQDQDLTFPSALPALGNILEVTGLASSSIVVGWRKPVKDWFTLTSATPTVTVDGNDSKRFKLDPQHTPITIAFTNLEQHDLVLLKVRGHATNTVTLDSAVDGDAFVLPTDDTKAVLVSLIPEGSNIHASVMHEVAW